MTLTRLFSSFLAASLGLAAIPGGLPAASIPGLYNTGVSTSGALLPGGSVDPHYRMIQSTDTQFPGPNAMVVNEGWPIVPAANGVWIANGPSSKWLGPQAAQGNGNQPGDYVYRLTFDLTGLEPSSAVITGRWTSDNAATDIRINGVGTGINYDGNFGAWSASWTISSGFREGTNTLDFVINNAGTAVNPTAFRVELSGTADYEAPPGTPPSILEQPVSATVGQGDAVTFEVSIYGAKPLFYQWRLNGEPILGANSASFSIPSAGSSDAGAYDVVVTNAAGMATSDAATLSIVVLSPAQLSYEPAGPSSRRTGLAFTEIMYHPPKRADGRTLEFVELYNSNPFYEDLGGYRLAGQLDYTFPAGTRIEGLCYVVIAPVPEDVMAVYGLANVLGGATNRLANNGGRLQLLKPSGGVVLDVTYDDQPPWPAAADGTGHSLVLVRPSHGERDPHAWAASAQRGGSPGAPDPVPAGPLENVVINEILAHTDLPNLDYLELYNHSPVPVDVSGGWLSDDPATNKFQIPADTTLPANGFLTFDETQLGFALAADGETVYLVSPDQQRVIDCLRYGGQANGVAFGRYPDGAELFQELTCPSPDAPNAPMRIRNVVIHEIMYHPISNDAEDEYVELYNRGETAVEMGGWRFSDGIDYAFPPGTAIDPGGYLVVAKNAARLLTNHPGLNPAVVVGDFGGTLADGGDRLVLAMPEFDLETNAVSGLVRTNTFFVVADEVVYADGGRWGMWADGGGSSLELKDPRSDNRLAANWADSDETAKAPWTLVEHTGLLDHGTGSASTNLQIHLQDAGEALVDDVEVIAVTPAGGNRIPNSTFESGTAGWVFKGTHRRTSLETAEGHNSARSLHLRATDRGDTVNFVRATFSSPFNANNTATIRAWVRWLRGQPEILFRFKENYLEAVGFMTVPANLGTPGAPNSTAVPNAPPAITAVSHRPALPAANQPIRVQARVHDADGVAAVTLRYRIDPASTLVSVPMGDDGTSGDLVAGDGVYGAVIPGQSASRLVAFRIEATDAAATPAASQFPADAPARECLVRTGESVPAGAFGTYRMWMTQATFDFWTNREKMSNEALDVTFVYGSHRIIYNAGSYFAGSAWTSPGYTTPSGNLCGYDILYPDDDLLLGDDHVTLDWPVRDPTNQREQMMFWLLEQYGLPNLYRRYIHMFVNGTRRGTIYDDVQQPGTDVLEEWFPEDDEGDLFKTNFYFEYADNQAREGGTPNTLEIFATTGGQKKIARYRWNWKPRAMRGSANDFRVLLDLVDAVNSQGAAYIPAVESQVDMEHWMRTFAMNDLASYWDAFGNPNYKNTYLYKPERSGWKLFCWDFDVGLGAGIGIDNELYNAPLFPGNIDPTVQRLYQTPVFVRAYWRALEEAVNTFFTAEAVTPIVTAKYDAFVANGVNLTSPLVSSGRGYSLPGFVAQRRAWLLTQLATVAAPFAVAAPDQVTLDTNLLVLNGTAPVGVAALTVNGQPYPAAWASVSNWTLRIPVPAGSNLLTIAGVDRLGHPVDGATRDLAVTFSGTNLSPVGVVVISEIMFNPLTPDTSFVELHNTSATHAFDLSGWRVNGLGFTFPSGSTLLPGQFIVLARDAIAFGAAFGNDQPVFAEFEGALDNDGETLSLRMPGAAPGEEIEVDRVTYDDLAPWPTAANGQGPSLQVLDPLQDNSRVSNWTDGQGWRFFSTNRNVGSVITTPFRLSFYFESSGGDVYLDDIRFAQEDTPGQGTNVLDNPGFESGLASWGLGPLATNSMVIGTDAHSGGSCLQLVVAPGGASLTTFYQELATITRSTNYTLSFWYKPGTAGTNLSARVSSLFRTSLLIEEILATPGEPNAGAQSLPPYPPLWLSEIQPDNQSTVADNRAEIDPWIEIHNAGSERLSLDGCYLSTDLGRLTAWAFPESPPLEPGEYRLVWADAQPEQSDTAHWHASFRLNPTNGSVYLSQSVAGTTRILDYYHYSDVPPDRSYGTYPPGQNSWRDTFHYPTPGNTNNPATPPLALFINEWMASNNGSVLDPADQDADDWFEIHNPNDEPVNLAGYRLTDNPADPTQYIIGDGFEIPAGGFQLVWADEETSQTEPPGRLHVNFRLSANGESIMLFAADGQLVDAVAFGTQSANVSEGRFPDGNRPPFRLLDPFTPGAPNRIPAEAAPVIRSILADLPEGRVTLVWDAEANRTYRLQYKERLDDPAWLDLEGEITAAGSTASKEDATLGGAAQRFYRVLRVP
ncbi:MAG: lamin tail domain-containing protein [Verrucomicrobia bacterium]|nr:lamin tail domain-containing protein [Verrucomicrobiota bacterium]